MEVFGLGIQAEEFLRALPPLESLLLSLLTSYSTVRLFDQVVQRAVEITCWGCVALTGSTAG